jgi:L-ascorbate metabolism protein UlaG (beta-lactamase superfamily)
VAANKLDITVTWIGHATVLIEAAGLRLLTDPILTSRVAHLRRRVPAPEIEPVDVIVLSHLHMDHLHLRSLREIAEGARVIAPRGAARLLRRLPVSAIDEVVAGDELSLSSADPGGTSIRLQVVPADHSNSRGPHSRIIAEPVGYVIRTDCPSASRAVYFAGDTDLFDEMHSLTPIDIALIPIWGWGPTLGERHLDPGRAATATAWIDPRQVIPIHWGTYTPITPRRGTPEWIDDPLAAFTTELDRIGMSHRMVALRPGQSATTAD